MLIDLHNHVEEGSDDSRVSARELARLGRERGLDGLCVTDHDSFEAREAVLRAAAEVGVLMLQGVEVRTERGHLLLYGPETPFWKQEGMVIATHHLQRLIQNRDQVALSELQRTLAVLTKVPGTAMEVIEYTRQHDGCVALAHPLSYAGDNPASLHSLMRQWLRDHTGEVDMGQFLRHVGDTDHGWLDVLESVDAIETCNALALVAENHAAALLAAELGKPGIGGSDAHWASLVGLCATRIQGSVCTIAELTAAIKRRRTQAVYMVPR